MIIQRTIVNTLTFTLFGVFQKALSFILIPLYTAQLSAYDLGVVATITTLTAILDVLFTMSLDACIVRFHYSNSGDPNYHRRLYGTLLVSFSVLSIFWLVLFVAGARWMAIPLKGIPLMPYYYLGLVTCTLSPFLKMFQRVQRAEHRAKEFGFTNVSLLIVKASLIIFGVLVLRLKAEAVLLGEALATLVFSAYGFVRLFKRFGFSVDLGILKRATEYSLPLIPNALAAYSNGFLNNYLLNTIFNVSVSGFFYLGQQISNMLSLFIDSFSNAIQPLFYEVFEGGEDRERRIVLQMMYAFLALLSLAGFVIALFSSEISSLLVRSQQYSTAWKAIPALVFYSVTNQIKNVWLHPLMRDSKGTRYAPMATYTNVLMNAALLLILIPKFSVLGAAYATFFARYFSSFVMMYYSRKFHNIGLSPLRIYVPTTLLFLLAHTAFVTHPQIIYFKGLLVLLALGGFVGLYRKHVEKISRALFGAVALRLRPAAS